MQLPSGYVTELGLRDRVRLELEPDHVGVWPDAERNKPVEVEELAALDVAETGEHAQATPDEQDQTDENAAFRRPTEDS